MRMKDSMLRRVFSVLLAAAMLFGADMGSITGSVIGGIVNLSLTVSAEDVQTYGDYEYEVSSDNTVTITKYKGNDAAVVVPGEINELPVTVIGDQAFCYCLNLRSVRIPNGVTSIGDYAFSDCSGLTSITMPDSVTSIGSGAFYFCIGLTDVTISNSLTNVGEEVFFRCTKLQSVTIPNSVTSICKWAFGGCVSLQSVTIPDSVTSIDSMAFSGCNNLQSIDVNKNNSVYSSYNGIVYDKNINKLIACPGAKTSVNIPDGVTSIGEYAFDECTKLQSVNIPESVTNIGQYAFSNCTSLPSINIPKSVTSIGERAFHRCTSLSYIALPDSVTSIGMEAFSYCKNLQSAVIPNSVTSIVTGMFFECTSLQSLTIPDSVTSIGNSAFFYCTSLQSVTIPNGVKSIGTAAFSNCTILKSVTIPNSVTSIEYAAFGDCTSLKSVTIRNSVTNIGEDAFRNCPELTISAPKGSYAETYAEENDIAFKAITETPVSDFEYETGTDGFITITKYNGSDTTVVIPQKIKGIKVTRIGGSAFHDQENISGVIIPDSVVSIGNMAFYGCDILTIYGQKGSCAETYASENGIPFEEIQNKTSSEDFEYKISDNQSYVIITKYKGNAQVVNIPETIDGKEVKIIGRYAFSQCESMTSVTIPDSVITIESYAFSRCKNLESVKLPDSVTALKQQSFEYCTSLRSITIPKNVKTIDDMTFYQADSLVSVYVAAENAVFSSEDGVLYNKTKTKLIMCPIGKKTVTIPDSVISIGNYAFLYCTHLTSIDIPDSVKSIGSSAFFWCDNISSIEIPESVTFIGMQAFGACSKLSSVKIPESVDSLGEWAFANCQSLQSVILPKSLSRIENRTFSECTNLSSVTIPNSIKSIGQFAFFECTALSYITIPNSVTSIENAAFWKCSGLQSIRIPDSVVLMGEGVYADCTNMKSAEISVGLTNIPNFSFQGCTNLTSVTIPSGITSIGYGTFSECVNLKSITIPESVTDIDSYVFENISDITISGKKGSYAETYAEENRIPFEAIEETNVSDFEYETGSDGFITITRYKGNDAEVVVPGEIDGKKVKRIGYAAFNDCTDLVSVTIPDGVTDIGVTPSGVIYSYYGTFKNCTNLVSVKIPDSVSYIGNGTFAECSSLREVKIPDGITSIGDGLFEGCQSLKSVTIPRKATRIGQAAFERCSGLTSLTIPSGIEYIADYAFYFCPGITHIDLPDSVKDIGDCAFRMCNGLKTIVIPASVTSIGSEAFKGCDDLTVSGKKGSYAETYANDNGIPFKAISEEKISVTSLTITLSQTVFTYDGSEKKPAVTVTDGTKTLVKGTDYTLSYENNTEAGTAYAVINGTGSYGDTARISYTINKRSAASLTITLSQTVFTYDGSEKRPAVTATDGTKTLVKGTDYTLSYSDNISAGTGRVTVKGINNYTDEKSKTFSIGRRSLENAVLTIKPGSFTYDGARKKPTVTVSLDGKALTTEDYAVVYSNNVNAGTAKVVVNGRINYNGSVEKTFKISPLSITPFSIALESDTYTYDGNPKTPMVTVTNGTKKLTQGTDFTVAYSDNINEGTGYVTVKGIRNYSGSVKKSFTIEPPPKISISDMLITVNASFGIVYNGEPRTPEVIIQKGKTRLKEGTDFRCNYSDNINAGTAGIKIEGIGKYTGTVTKSFTILPMSIYKASVSVAENSIPYDGTKQTPRVDVELNGKTLARGTDFSVTYSNNTNIGISIVTITGKNNYTGHAYGKFSIVSGKKQFVWGQDNYNFINSSSLGYFPKMTYRSMINKTYLDVLANKYTLTNSEYQTVFIGNGEKVAWLDEPFDGACYGMASTAFLAKSGFLNAGDYMTGAKNIYDLNYPINNEKLCSLIIYYQMIQVKNVIMQQRKKVAKMSNEAVIKGIRELLDNNSLVLVGFKKEKWGAHAIIAYGYDNDMHIKNGKTYNGRIWIYDPNKSTEKNEDFFIYYNSSDNYSWTIPGYRQNSDISSGAGACFSYYGASVDDINSGGYLFRVNKIFNNSLSDYIARIDAYKLSGDGHVNKVSADPSRIGTYMNAASAPDEIVADYSYIIAGKGAGTMGYNLYDSDSAYKVSQDKPSELDLSIDYEYCDLSARAESCNSVIFDKDGRVVLDCENSGYTVSMTFDDDYPTDYFAVRVSGADANNVTFEKAENGYILRADNIRNLKIFANNRTDTVTAGLSATKYKSVLIYETDSSTLGLKVDTDGNGTFETKLSVYSILENNSVISAQKIKKGSSVKVSASASGGSGGYTYAVLYKKHASSNWVTVQGFKENSTVSIKPTSAGLYDICVKARDSKGNVDKKYFSVNVIAPLENDSTISATSISKGSSVIVKADATGGTGSYEYAVYYKKASSSSWSTVQKYKTNSRITITPSAAVVYDICVKVKDSAGSISKKYFTINVVAAPLTNKSTVSSKSIRLGGSVTMKASASGGSGSYNFAVLYKKSDKTSWTTKQSYSTNSTVTIKPGAAVDYDIMVKAKDSSGAVANKKFKVSVVR